MSDKDMIENTENTGKTDDKNIHKGHRERLRNLYLEEGLDNFSPHNVLELMLFYAIPVKDTNPLAHKLIEKFGSFSGVLEASADDIAAVDNIGKKTAALLKLFLDVYRYYSVDKEKAKTFYSLNEIGDWLKPRFFGKRSEIVALLCLDSKYSYLSCPIINEGSVNATSVNFRLIAQHALQHNTTFAVLAHNHPNGFAAPSRQDIETTRNLNEFLKTLNIVLLDHIVYADDDYVSMAQSGYIPSFMK